jgi:hypothetical protein
MLLAAHPSRRFFPSSGELFDLFKERELRRAKNPSVLYIGSRLFTLIELASPLQIPLEKYDHFIAVIGATEDLSPSGTTSLAVGAVCVKDQLPPGIVQHFLADQQVRHPSTTSVLYSSNWPLLVGEERWLRLVEIRPLVSAMLATPLA